MTCVGAWPTPRAGRARDVAAVVAYRGNDMAAEQSAPHDGARSLTLRVGDPAPNLDLPDLAGRAWSLHEQRGHPVLVSFLRHAG